jgi:multiple sugar transport system ATP-binding protein
MVAGLEEISSGDIFIDGRRINDVPPKDRDIAMVFQNYALYPHMTVYQNMAFGLKLRKFPRAEIDLRVREAAEILDITHLLERKPKALSGGQRQRVAVGRAIVRKPKAFLFDEPLSNLDAKMRVQMRMEINKLHTRLQSTMIYVTHDQVEAMTMGDRIVVMKDGEVQQVAAPLEIYNRPANRFVAGFIGSPPMNFLPVTVRSHGDFLHVVADGVDLRVDPIHEGALRGRVGQPVVLGIRPEDMSDPLFAGGPGAGQTLAARVEVVEPMGAEVYLHVTAAGHPLVARVGPSLVADVNQALSLNITMHKAHFFDVATGVAL